MRADALTKVDDIRNSNRNCLRTREIVNLTIFTSYYFLYAETFILRRYINTSSPGDFHIMCRTVASVIFGCNGLSLQQSSMYNSGLTRALRAARSAAAEAAEVLTSLLLTPKNGNREAEEVSLLVPDSVLVRSDR
jgi:hypothetical protein